MVSDSLSCSLAVSLMGSLAVLLPLSLVYLHLAESFTMFLLGALVVYQLFSDHVSGWVSGYVHLFLWPCSVPVSPNCMELFLWGAVWLLGSASGQHLRCVSGCPSVVLVECLAMFLSG